MNRKKELISDYKRTRRSMGVYQIRNQSNERVFIGSTVDLPGIFNRHRFRLEMGGHPNPALQQDWDRSGGKDFAFEVLEELFPRENADLDLAAELEFLEDLWLGKLEPFGANGYNERKRTREERLQMIAANKRKTEHCEQQFNK